MTVEELKRAVLKANLLLPELGLAMFTWGNVSAVDRERGIVVIKPSGVDYGTMTEDDMVVLSMDGTPVAGSLRPSSDTPTHIELYRAFGDIGAVVHTHSTYAVAWAQARRAVPCLGTTHADTFYGEIPCTRYLTKEEVDGEYEKNTGLVIEETFAGRDHNAVPGVLCAGHGPFAWGPDPDHAVYNAAVLEECAKMALLTLRADPAAPPAEQYLVDRHYLRKHGKDAYYGQK